MFFSIQNKSSYHNCGMFHGAGKRIFEVGIKMTFSKAMKADCIIWYGEFKSPIRVKKMLKAKNLKNKVAPLDGSINAWHVRFK